MYKSPVNIIETAMRKLAEERDNAIMYKIQSAFDVDVDKEELMRALKYDRGQYETGYRDGVSDATPKWIPVSERLPEYGEKVLAYYEDGTQLSMPYVYSDSFPKIFSGEVGRAFSVATHWMPLPEPPKENEHE